MGSEERDSPAGDGYPPIPYGWADFEAMRRERTLYVDKTRFLHDLEQERYAFLIRPRRFGKSCWVALLESYYDRTRAGRFEALFAGTDIGRRPTPNRNRYVILRFDFSAFDDTLETLRERFETYCLIVLRYALEGNGDLFPEPVIERILSHPSIDGKLNELFKYAAQRGIWLYVLIDEYDNFANTVLAYRGAEAYHSFTHGGGFYRNFFATLKAGAGHGAIERLFVTGVSPITMDDVTSGFNIAANVSLKPAFNELLGFTEGEVRAVLEGYREHGAFDQDVDQAMAVMGEWYDGYRFAAGAANDLHNPDMVLYYLKESMPNDGPPDDLIDTNVRIDYGKLRHLLTVDRQLNGNFDLLRRIIGEGWADSDIRTGFPLEQLHERENFLSLLHYFGLLSIREVREAAPRLGIPNQTVRRLMYGYLRDGYRSVDVFSVDLYAFGRLLHEMAYRGAWRPVLEFLKRGHRPPERHPRLHGRREGDSGIPGRLPERHRSLHIPHRAGAGRRLRGHLPGAAPAALHGYAARLRDRTEVPAAQGASERVARGEGGARGGRAGTALRGRRAAGAAISVGPLHRLGGGVPRLGTGPLPSGAGAGPNRRR